MPSRPACVAILFFWVYAAGGLLRRDILPDYYITPPPDLRSIAAAEEDTRPTSWELSVAEDNGTPGIRSVGRAVTKSTRTIDGGTILTGQVWFDSGSLLRGTPFEVQHNERLEVVNTLEIDPSGNLRRFHATVHSAADRFDLVTIDGEVKGSKMAVKATGPIPVLTFEKTYDYEPRGIIQNAIGPTDRLPGLQVGQRWVTHVFSPLTGQLKPVTVEVTGKHVMQWNGGVETTLVVEQHVAPFSVRSWVRKDGLVLRQEIPFPFQKLVLERIPDRNEPGMTGIKIP